jgi:hypothetical protein
MREWICHLQLLLAHGPHQQSRSQVRVPWDSWSYILLSQIWDSPNLEGQVPIFIFPRNRVAQFYPQALGCYIRVLCYDRWSVSQSVSTHLGLMTRFLIPYDSCRFVDVGRFLWWEDGSVVYNCCWPSLVQSFSGPNPMELVTIFYCLRFETSLFVASYDS